MTTKKFLKTDGKDRRFVRVFTAEELGFISAIFNCYALSQGFVLGESAKLNFSDIDSDLVYRTNVLYQAFEICSEDYE